MPDVPSQKSQVLFVARPAIRRLKRVATPEPAPRRESSREVSVGAR
jgi:hypothetical protein